MNLNSKYFDRIRINPDGRAGRERRRAALRVARLRPAGRLSRPQGPVARGRVPQFLPRPRARIQQVLQLLRRHGATTTSSPISAPLRPATARPGRWASSTATAATRPKSRKTWARAFTDPFGIFGGAFRRGDAKSRAKGGRCKNLERRSFAALDLDGHETRIGDQGALQGAGEAPPSRRQWRRPQLGRSPATDHPGLPLPADPPVSAKTAADRRADARSLSAASQWRHGGAMTELNRELSPACPT